MIWEKTGFHFNSDEYLGEYRGAMVPRAVHMIDDVFRIFYSPRDKDGRCHIFHMDIDITKLRILEVGGKPILSPGDLGTFDDSGAQVSWVCRTHNKWWIYYVGWNLGVTVPFRNSVGLAESDDGVHFVRAYNGPIIDRTKDEPYFCSSPCVLDCGGAYRAWYVSCVKWRLDDNGAPKHWYHIKYADSNDGMNWNREGIVAIDFKNEQEYAITTPSVIKYKDIYHMWYCYRGDKYRIGHAISTDGKLWERMDDDVGIDVSEEGFDSEMVCYPHVFLHNGEWHMLYNGNGYGKTGFGLAKLKGGLWG